MGDVSFSFRSGCHLLGLEVPCGFPPFFSLDCFSTSVEVSCAFPLCDSHNIDGYFHMNNEAFFGGEFGVYRE